MHNDYKHWVIFVNTKFYLNLSMSIENFEKKCKCEKSNEYLTGAPRILNRSATNPKQERHES